MASKKINFTKTAIVSLPLPEPGKRFCYYDEKVPGLELRITSVGVKSFYLYRKISGKAERILLGRFPAMAPEIARTRAGQLNSEIAMGKNPANEKRLLKAEVTLGELFDRFLTFHAKPHKKSWKTDEWLFKTYFVRWKNRRISTICHTDVQTLHHQIGMDSGKYAANRAYALLTSLFSYARKNGFRGENPCVGIEKFREQKRDRFIQESELHDFLTAVTGEPDTTLRDFVLMALFTGQRRGNVLTMRWDEINFDRAEWRIPGEKVKNKDTHIVPLIKPAMDVLRERREKSDSQWVFPSGRTDTHLVEPKSAWARITKRAKVQDLRIHDLRRTLASYMAINGESLLIISQMLGHKIASTSVTGIYARLSLEPVRQAMEAAVRSIFIYAELIEQESNTIPFRMRQ